MNKNRVLSRKEIYDGLMDDMRHAAVAHPDDYAKAKARVTKLNGEQLTSEQADFVLVCESLGAELLPTKEDTGQPAQASPA